MIRFWTQGFCLIPLHTKEQSLKTKEERDHMSKVPYASTIGSLIYAMVCTRPDIAHAVRVVSKYMSRLGK